VTGLADSNPSKWLREEIVVRRWWLLLISIGWFLLALGRVLEWLWA